MTLGPLLQRRELRLINGITVVGQVLVQQSETNQQLTQLFPTDFDQHNHDYTLGTALAIVRS